MWVSINGPVGLRWRQQNVKNASEDQAKIISLLASISNSLGGKKEDWPAPPLAGPNGSCPKWVADAIWDFQLFWKKNGVFHNIDGVVDPGMNTLKQLNFLAAGSAPVPPPKPTPPAKVIVTNPRIPGTWQITSVWAVTVGEVGQVGGVQIEIAQPDNRRFKMTGVGAGFGVSIDPVSYLKLLGKVKTDFVKGLLQEIAMMVGSNLLFNIGDYLQKLGVNMLSVTGGRIIPNPLNEYIGKPTQLSRYMLTGSSAAREPFGVYSAGGGVGAGMEGGFICFGFPGNVLSPALAVYGSSGLTAKVGVSVQGLLYHCANVEDV